MTFGGIYEDEFAELLGISVTEAHGILEYLDDEENE